MWYQLGEAGFVFSKTMLIAVKDAVDNYMLNYCFFDDSFKNFDDVGCQ